MPVDLAGQPVAPDRMNMDDAISPSPISATRA